MFVLAGPETFCRQIDSAVPYLSYWPFNFLHLRSDLHLQSFIPQEINHFLQKFYDNNQDCFSCSDSCKYEVSRIQSTFE